MFNLPLLPWESTELEPMMSAHTLSFHYEKHHQTYVTNLNNLVKDTPYEFMDLEDIIVKSSGGIFNNAAQVWNHTFFWESLGVGNDFTPESKIGKQIIAEFGSYDEFKAKFTQAGLSLFGSGWVWLVLNKEGKLQIIPMSNAGNPLTEGHLPILVCDVWEHAYYLDYQNRRGEYLENFWKIINWQKVEERLVKAGK
ncbi:MAG TPA: superoxide dismutase [Bacteroidales bacterium]|nr:superoxide dismutase [Bacteroidales bacterium]